MSELQEKSTQENGSDNGLDMKTLFVRSIPMDVTDEQLTEFFSNFAPTKHAVVVKDTNKRSRGFGFVSFATEEDAQDALTKARKTKLQDHLLRVDVARRRDRSKKNETKDTEEQFSNSKEKSKSNQQEDTSTVSNEDTEDILKGKPKLIIRNMPWSCRDPNKLKKIFNRFGTVVEATIPRKRDGKLCGFAFVTMKKISNCKNALENTKDLKIDGRPVAVDFAVQKNRWEDYKKKHKSDEVSEDSGEEEDISDSEEEEESSDDSDISLDSDEEVTDDEADLDDIEEDKDKPTKQHRNKRERFSIFVRNVPYDTTAESLADHFNKFGPVKYALPVIDKETGLAKGTAFVAFRDEKTYNYCIENAPAAGATSLLIDDDVLPEYVYEGRILSVTPALDREEANIRAEKNAEKRKQILGKASGERDKRNLYLLNEGKVVGGSKLSQLLTPKDMEIRERSYNLRVEQLKRNPSLRLSLTRLAIRNLPRAMTDKALKALARKAVVEFATQVKNGERHPLSQEEIIRSTREKYKFMTPEQIEQQKRKDKKKGVVKQAKVIMEVKGSTVGRSRGYGFVEYKDHKHALMGLRWLNVHLVTRMEVLDGLTDEEKKLIDFDDTKGRRLCVEFAIDNSNVVKRRIENTTKARSNAKRKKEEELAQQHQKKQKTEETSQSKDKNNGMSSDVRRLIGFKRKKKNAKK